MDEIIKIEVYWSYTKPNETSTPMHTLKVVGEESYKALEELMIDMPYILKRVVDKSST